LNIIYKKFKDRSTNFGNLFIAVGNAKLHNKIACNMTDQKVFVIKTLQSSGGPGFAAERL
jgi:hypothetical protein